MVPKEQKNARETILGATFKLLNKVPYTKLSMLCIAREAGVSKALLFYHFKSKVELAREALILGMKEELELLDMLKDLEGVHLSRLLPRWLALSTTRIMIIQNSMEVVDLRDPDDPLVMFMRDGYHKIMVFLERLLRERGKDFPKEKALLLTLAIDVFGLVTLVKDGEPEIECYVKALLDIIGIEVNE